jgi:hypothetical protein
MHVDTKGPQGLAESPDLRPGIRKLYEFERHSMRVAFSHEYLNGTDTARSNLQLLATTLAEKYHCSPQQITSIGAQLKIRANRALEQHGLMGVCAVENLMGCYVLHVMGIIEGSSAAALTFATELLNRGATKPIDPSTVNTLLTCYAELIEDDIKRQGMPVELSTTIDPPTVAKVKAPVMPSPPPIEAKVERAPIHSAALLSDANVLQHAAPQEKALGDSPQTSNSRGAAYVDYRFANKRLWHQREEVYIRNFAARFSKAELELKDVLCMPGTRYEGMQEEIGMLKAIGFDPRRIYAVEGTNDEVRLREFRESCARLGIVPIEAKLEQCITRLQKKFSVVMFDFVGPANKTYEYILKNALFARDAALLVNLMVGREQAGMQETMRGDYHFHFHGGLDKIFERGDGSDAKMEAIELATLREAIVEHRLLSLAGVDRPERYSLPDRTIERFGWGKDLSHAIIGFYLAAEGYLPRLCQIFQMLFDRIDADSMQKPIFPKYVFIRDLTAPSIVGQKYISDVARYGYKSQASRRGRNFYSIFATLNAGPHEQWRHSAKLFGDYLATMLAFNTMRDPASNIPNYDLSICVRDKFRHTKKLSEPIYWSDEIGLSVTYGNKKSDVGWIKNSTLRNEILAYQKFSCDKKILGTEGIAKIPREILSESESSG